MLATLEGFLAQLSELRTFVRALPDTYAAMAKEENRDIHSAISIRRRLDYSAVVVVLYASFERFVEDFVWSRAEIDVLRKSYDQLPDALRDKHLHDSAELLVRRRLGKGRYETLTNEEVVRNLHLCMSKAEPYRMTKAAVIKHDNNLREEVVVGLFAAIGIADLDKEVRNSSTMVAWFRAVEGSETATTVPPGTVERRIKDLIDRRNEVAHGGGSISESLSSGEMMERIEFFEAYARSLFQVVGGEYIATYHKDGVGHDLGAFMGGPFKGGLVVVIAKPSVRLDVGQPVFASTGKRVHHWGRIQELRVDSVSVDAVDAGTSTDSVGLRLSFRVRKSDRLFVIADRDALVWE
ncbi:MAG: MAE_28990/MAE_18760 family HEPN-like nuclease [Acidobacteriota bacterium]